MNRTSPSPARRRPYQRGVALLLAMLLVTMVATLAAGMVWQQSRAIDVEAAERAHAEAEWILTGALDWARLILREDARSGRPTSLGEPWATPLAEARLSSFLAADSQNNSDDGPDAFLSGYIVDAQSRYNLRDLIDAHGKLDPVQFAAFQRLCTAANIGSEMPGLIADGLVAAWAATAAANTAAGGNTASTTAAATAAGDAATVPIAPQRISQLGWLGVDAETLARLEPYVTLLPAPTPVDANTAASQVLLAAIDGLDAGTAERLVQTRQNTAFASLDDVNKLLPQGVKADPARVGVLSSYFEVYGRLRIDTRVVEERSLVQRRGPGRGLDIVVLQRERHSMPLGNS